MLGFITTKEIVDSANTDLLSSFTKQDIKPFISLAYRELITGGVFLPLEDSYLHMNCIENNKLIELIPIINLINSLGGLNARIDKSLEDFITIPDIFSL